MNDEQLKTIQQRVKELERSTKAPKLKRHERDYCMAALNECTGLLQLVSGKLTPQQYLAMAHIPDAAKKAVKKAKAAT